MPSVVVVGAFVECSHSGKAKLTSGNDKLKVGGSAVVTKGSEIGLSFLPSTAPSTPDNPTPCAQLNAAVTSPSPCTATLGADSGVSTKIKVNGVGVLLDTTTGATVNSNPALPLT